MISEVGKDGQEDDDSEDDDDDEGGDDDDLASMPRTGYTAAAAIEYTAADTMIES